MRKLAGLTCVGIVGLAGCLEAVVVDDVTTTTGGAGGAPAGGSGGVATAGAGGGAGGTGAMAVCEPASDALLKLPMVATAVDAGAVQQGRYIFFDALFLEEVGDTYRYAVRPRCQADRETPVGETGLVELTFDSDVCASKPACQGIEDPNACGELVDPLVVAPEASGLVEATVRVSVCGRACGSDRICGVGLVDAFISGLWVPILNGEVTFVPSTGLAPEDITYGCDATPFANPPSLCVPSVAN